MRNIVLTLCFILYSGFAYSQYGGGYGDSMGGSMDNGRQWNGQLKGNTNKVQEALKKAYQKKGKELKINKMPKDQQNNDGGYGGGGY